MGRNRQPDALKELRGNPRKERLHVDAGANGDEAAAYDVPPRLSDDARDIFVEIADRLLPKNILQTTDFGALSRYAVWMAKWWKHYQIVEAAGGDIYETRSKHMGDDTPMLRLLPSFQIMEKAELHIFRLETQLGLTPMARQALLARMRGLTGFDPWAGLPLGDAVRDGVGGSDDSAAGGGEEGAGAPSAADSPLGMLALPMPGQKPN